MHNSLGTFKQVPTSASRRVWEGKAGNYSAKTRLLAIPVSVQVLHGATAAGKVWLFGRIGGIVHRRNPKLQIIEANRI